jgi:hypothetical protein
MDNVLHGYNAMLEQLADDILSAAAPAPARSRKQPEAAERPKKNTAKNAAVKTETPEIAKRAAEPTKPKELKPKVLRLPEPILSLGRTAPQLTQRDIDQLQELINWTAANITDAQDYIAVSYAPRDRTWYVYSLQHSSQNRFLSGAVINYIRQAEGNNATDD